MADDVTSPPFRPPLTITIEQARPCAWLVEATGTLPVMVCGPTRDHAFARAIDVAIGLRAICDSKTLEHKGDR